MIDEFFMPQKYEKIYYLCRMASRLNISFRSLLAPFMPLLLFLLPWGCSGHDGGNSQEEEEAIFAMVNDPGAEGLYDVVVGRADSLLLCARMSDTLRGYVMIEKGVALYNWGRILEAVAFADTMAMFSAVSILGSVMAGDGQYSETIRLLTPYTGIADSFPQSGQIKLYTPLVKAYTALDSLEAAHRVLGLMKAAAEELPAGHQAAVATLMAEAELLGREGRWKEKWRLHPRSARGS